MLSRGIRTRSKEQNPLSIVLNPILGPMSPTLEHDVRNEKFKGLDGWTRKEHRFRQSNKACYKPPTEAHKTAGGISPESLNRRPFIQLALQRHRRKQQKEPLSAFSKGLNRPLQLWLRFSPHARKRAVVFPPDGHDEIVDAVLLAVDDELGDHLFSHHGYSETVGNCHAGTRFSHKGKGNGKHDRVTYTEP